MRLQQWDVTKKLLIFVCIYMAKQRHIESLILIQDGQAHISTNNHEVKPD